MNHMIPITAVTRVRLDTDGRPYYRRKRADGKKPLEAMRCLKRRISDAIYRPLLADAEHGSPNGPGRAPAGRLFNPARSTYPRTSTTCDQPLPGPAHATLRPQPPARKSTLKPTG
jgi:hypothetical protein